MAVWFRMVADQKLSHVDQTVGEQRMRCRVRQMPVTVRRDKDDARWCAMVSDERAIVAMDDFQAASFQQAMFVQFANDLARIASEDRKHAQRPPAGGMRGLPSPATVITFDAAPGPLGVELRAMRFARDRRSALGIETLFIFDVVVGERGSICRRCDDVGHVVLLSVWKERNADD